MKGLQFTRTPAGNRRPVKNQTNNKGVYYSDVKVRVQPDYSRNTMSVNNLPVNPETIALLTKPGQQMIEPISSVENADKMVILSDSTTNSMEIHHVVPVLETDVSTLSNNIGNSLLDLNDKPESLSHDYDTQTNIIMPELKPIVVTSMIETNLSKDVSKIGQQILEPIVQIENQHKLTTNETVHIDIESMLHIPNIQTPILDVDVGLCSKPNDPLLIDQLGSREPTNNDQLSGPSVIEFNKEPIVITTFDKLVVPEVEIKKPKEVEIIVDTENKKTFDTFLSNLEVVPLPQPVHEEVKIKLETNVQHLMTGLLDTVNPVIQLDNNDILAMSNKRRRAYISESQFKAYLDKIKLTTRTIVNVYQLEYAGGILASGLGDFIRGSYYLFQVCRKYGLLVSIDLANHPVSMFLEKYINVKPNVATIKTIYSSVKKFEETNHNPYIGPNNVVSSEPDFLFDRDFFEYLSLNKVNNNSMFVCTIAYPNYKILEQDKEYMRNILKPTRTMEFIVDNVLTRLQLTKKRYQVIHVRYGDKFLFQDDDSVLETKQLATVISDLTKIEHEKQNGNSNGNTDYLLVADNAVIKKIVKRLFPKIRVLEHDISHTGENKMIDIDKLKNTMIDFILLSYATNIKSYSVYKHGSGFSQWCADTYNIPYVCIYIGG